MKKDIHPQAHPVIFRDTAAKKDFVMYSTMKSEQVEKLNGVDHYVVRLDVSSATHPFYTGQQHLVDTSGQVEKFQAKMARAKKPNVSKSSVVEAAKGKAGKQQDEGGAANDEVVEEGQKVA